MAWGFGVDVMWPGKHRRGILIHSHPACSNGFPVLLIAGQPYTPSDLMPEVRITAKWPKPGVRPMWHIIQKAIDAGFPITVDRVR